MTSLLFATLSLSAVAQGSPVATELTTTIRALPEVNGTVEYASSCKTCPYNLCTNVFNAGNGDIVPLTCWAAGDMIGDTDLWLRTTNGCYFPEYDLIEYEGDFTKDLETCGEIPMTITKQPVKVRYLSECKWRPIINGENMGYYGRDIDLTVTCWVPGGDVLDNPYWYKTTDNCHISATGLWQAPDHAKLDNCGPWPNARANETQIPLEDVVEKEKDFPITSERNDEEEKVPEAKGVDLSRRWLQPEEIGEEYAPCRSCAEPTTSPTCKLLMVYEYNQTVLSQCYLNKEWVYPNGTSTNFHWMLTTDWCWVKGEDFWIPPWDYYRYPSCSHWGYS